MQGFDSRPVPQFGDIVMLAMGTLERDLNEDKYTFIRNQNICSEVEQIDINCLRKMSSNVTALWSVQKVRHCDTNGNYRFELRFGVIALHPSRRQRRQNQELALFQYVAKQDDYPALFNGQLSSSDLKKRSDFFEGAQPIISSESVPSATHPPSSPAKSDSLNRGPYSPSIDRTIFDLLPFFGDDDDLLKSASQPQPHHANPNPYYTSLGAMHSPYHHRHPQSMARPVASPSDFYRYYAASPSHSSSPYRPQRPRPAYSPAGPPSFFSSLFNPLGSSTNVRPLTYKQPPSHDIRYPDSTFSYSSPFKSYAPPAQYHYASHHPAVSAVGTAPYQAPFLSQMLSSTANFNPISYFMNRNRPPTVNPVAATKPLPYYQWPPATAPFFDYKPEQSYHIPKKAVYYTPGYEMNPMGSHVNRPVSFKDVMSGAYSLQSQKYLPAHQLPSQQSLYQPAIPAFQPTAAQFITPSSPFSSLHQLSNPFVIQHMQMIPIGGGQQTQQPQQAHFQPQLLTQLSTIPLTETRTPYRYPPSIPLYEPEKVTQPVSSTPKTTSTSSAATATHGKDIFEIVREPKQTHYSEPDPLYRSNAREVASTTSTLLNKIQATPKISYFFPKADENTFTPHFPLVPASTARRNFSESDFKHVLQAHKHAQPASYQKLNNYFVTSGKGGVVYATPSTALPLQAAAYVKKQQSNIIYGQVMESKVQPPTNRPGIGKEVTRSQVPPPSKGTHQPPPVSSPNPTKPNKPVATTKPTKRTATPVNLITPPSTTRTTTTTTRTTTTVTQAPLTTPRIPPSTSTTSTTARTTTEGQTTSSTQRNPRGRQYSRGKATTTTTEKPVLKWMPKRKRPKQETSKISATLTQPATTLPRPHISNRTRIMAQASSHRPVIIPLDDVSMGLEEAHFHRRQSIQGTVERTHGITTLTPSRNKKRKNHVHHEYTNFVTVPSTSTTTRETAGALYQGDAAVPEPQRNVYTTTPYPATVTTPVTTVVIPTFTSRSVPSTTAVPETIVHTLERDVYTTSAMSHFLPTIPPPSAAAIVAAPPIPQELFELSRAPVETDTPDVELFRDNHEEEEEQEDGDEEDVDQDDDDDESQDDKDNEDEVTSGGLVQIAKTIVEHAKRVFEDTSSNEVDATEKSTTTEEEAVSKSPHQPSLEDA